jgi:hypothetical protein
VAALFCAIEIKGKQQATKTSKHVAFNFKM